MSDDFSLEELLTKLNDVYQEAEGNLGQCNVLIVGKTGVGKSTLINTIFREPLAKTGKGYPITQSIRQYQKDKFPISVYDTPGLELSGSQIDRVRVEVADLLETKKLLSLKEQIHVVWYCISHGSDRLDVVEKDWLQELELKDIPIILVTTKTLTRRRSEFIATLEAENLPVCQIVPVLAEPLDIDEEYAVKAHGLERLVETTFDLLPQIAQRAFVNGTKSITLKANEAFKYVSGYVTGAFVIGVTPIPFADAPILATMQGAMLVNITLIFGLPFDRGFIGTLFSTIAGAGGMAALGKTVVSNLLKMIPGAGTVLGGTISGTTASALTLALGLAYIEALKIYMRAQLEGREMSLPELAKLVTQLYQSYARSGQKTLKEDDAPPPRRIDIE